MTAFASAVWSICTDTAAAREEADKILALAAQVFAGLREDELAEVEVAIQRRLNFSGENINA